MVDKSMDTSDDDSKRKKEVRKSKSRSIPFFYRKVDKKLEKQKNLENTSENKNTLKDPKVDHFMQKMTQLDKDNPEIPSYPDDKSAGRFLRFKRGVRDFFSQRKADYQKHLGEDRNRLNSGKDETRPSKQDRLDWIDEYLQPAIGFLKENIRHISIIDHDLRDKYIKACDELIKSSYGYKSQAIYGDPSKRYENEKDFIETAICIIKIERTLRAHLKDIDKENKSKQEISTKKTAYDLYGEKTTQELYDKLQDLEKDISFNKIQEAFDQTFSPIQKQRTELSDQELSALNNIYQKIRVQIEPIKDRLDIISHYIRKDATISKESGAGNNQNKAMKEYYEKYKELFIPLNEMNYDIQQVIREKSQSLRKDLLPLWNKIRKEMNSLIDEKAYGDTGSQSSIGPEQASSIQDICNRQLQALFKNKPIGAKIEEIFELHEKIQIATQTLDNHIKQKFSDEIEDITQKINYIIDNDPLLDASTKKTLEAMKIFPSFENHFADWKEKITGYLDDHAQKQIPVIGYSFNEIFKRYKPLKQYLDDHKFDIDKSKSQEICEEIDSLIDEGDVLHNKFENLRDQINKTRKIRETDANQKQLADIDKLEKWYESKKPELLKQKEELKKYFPAQANEIKSEIQDEIQDEIHLSPEDISTLLSKAINDINMEINEWDGDREFFRLSNIKKRCDQEIRTLNSLEDYYESLKYNFNIEELFFTNKLIQEERENLYKLLQAKLPNQMETIEVIDNFDNVIKNNSELDAILKKNLETFKASPFEGYFRDWLPGWQDRITDYLDGHAQQQISHIEAFFKETDKNYTPLNQEVTSHDDETDLSKLQEIGKKIDYPVEEGDIFYNKFKVLRNQIDRTREIKKTDTNQKQLDDIDKLEEWWSKSKKSDILEQKEVLKKYFPETEQE